MKFDRGINRTFLRLIQTNDHAVITLTRDRVQNLTRCGPFSDTMKATHLVSCARPAVGVVNFYRVSHDTQQRLRRCGLSSWLHALQSFQP
ncbi:MAG: hypothetical protein ABL933_07440 [Methyloglobulus sp.]|nr:hypothetical protein [Methyloglobulus sp.]